MALIKYPVLLVELDAAHPDRAFGRKFGVQQADLDMHSFATREAAQAFMKTHDLVAVRPEDMARMREVHDAVDDAEDDH